MKNLTLEQLEIIERTIAHLDSLTERNLINNNGAWKETIRAKVELETMIGKKR